jgi:hypothetical protein
MSSLLQINGAAAVLRVGPYYSDGDRDFIELIANGSDTKVVSPNERFWIQNTLGHILLDASGNIGIGTTSPQSKLDIVQAGNTAGGTLMLSGNKTNNTIKYGYITTLQYASSDEPEGVVLIGGTNTSTFNRISIGGDIGEANAATEILFWTAANTTTRGGSTRMIIDSNGNVGIGTTSNLTGKINFPASDYGEGINFYTSATITNRTGIGKYLQEFRSYIPSGDAFTWYSGGPSGSEIVRFSGSGNVGIGTTSPASKLDVFGEGRFNVSAAGDTTTTALTLVNTTDAVNNGVRLAWKPLNASFETAYITTIREGANSFSSLVFATSTNGWGTGGPSERMRITSGGNVGIGTTSPDSRFHVGPSNGSQIRFDFVGSGDNYYDGVTHYFRNGNGASNIMTLLSGGSVGIGTTSPVAKLQVVGASSQGIVNIRTSTNTTGDEIGIIFGGTTYDKARIVAYNENSGNAAGQLRFYIGGSPATTDVTERMRITSDGNVGIGTTSPTNKLSVFSSGTEIANFYNSAYFAELYIQSNATNVITLAGGTGDAMSFETSGTERFRIASGGNVGIGTTSPGSLLHTYTTTAADNAGHIQYENANTGTGAATNAQLIGKSKYGTAQLMVWENYGIRFGMRSTANSGAGDIYFTTGTDSVQMVIKGGNVGINTTSPSFKLQVKSTAAADIAQFTGDQGFDGASRVYITNDASIYGRTNLVLTGRLDASNDGFDFGTGCRNSIVFNTNLGGAQGATGTAKYSIQLEGNSGTLYFQSSGSSAASRTGIAFTQNSNVGIGITSPQARLDVLSVLNIQATGNSDVPYINFSNNGRVYNWGRIGGLLQGDGDGALYFSTKLGGDVTEKMRITSGGNVGIGTTNPYSRLTIGGALSTGTSQISILNTEGGHYIIRTGIAGLQNQGLSIISADADGSNQNTRIAIASSGNVGIGTTSPSYTLDVVGTIRTTGSNPGFRTDNTTDYTSLAAHKSGARKWQLDTVGNSFQLYYDASSAYVFNISGSAGNVGIGTTSPGAKFEILDTDGQKLQMDGNELYHVNDSPFYIKSSGDIVFQPNGTTQVTINENGNVGIGTTSPSSVLDVVGNIEYSGITKGSRGENKNFSSYDWCWHGKKYAGYVSDVRTKLYEYFYTTTALTDEKYTNTYDADNNSRLSFDDENYTAIFTSHIHVKRQFTVSSVTLNGDDPYAMWVNGEYVSGADTCCSGVTYSYTFNVGWHRIDLIFSESGGGDYVSMGWNPKNYTEYIDAMTPFGPLDFYNNQLSMRGGNVGIGTLVPAYKLDVSGTIRATGDVIAYSDARVKDNVTTVENALDKVKSLRGVTYTRKDDDTKSLKVGVIAQEVLPILPEVVQQDNNGNYSVAYGNMVGVLIEAIKEQQRQIDDLKYLLQTINK